MWHAPLKWATYRRPRATTRPTKRAIAARATARAITRARVTNWAWVRCRGLDPPLPLALRSAAPHHLKRMKIIIQHVDSICACVGMHGMSTCTCARRCCGRAPELCLLKEPSIGERGLALVYRPVSSQGWSRKALALGRPLGSLLVNWAMSSFAGALNFAGLSARRGGRRALPRATRTAAWWVLESGLQIGARARAWVGAGVQGQG